MLTVVAGHRLENNTTKKSFKQIIQRLKTFFDIGIFRSALPVFFEGEAKNKNIGKYFCVVTVMAPSLTVSRVNRLTPVHTL